MDNIKKVFLRRYEDFVWSVGAYMVSVIYILADIEFILTDKEFKTGNIVYVILTINEIDNAVGAVNYARMQAAVTSVLVMSTG